MKTRKCLNSGNLCIKVTQLVIYLKKNITPEESPCDEGLCALIPVEFTFFLRDFIHELFIITAPYVII